LHAALRHKMGVAPNQSYMVGLRSLIWYGQKTGGPLIKPILRLVFYAEHRRPTLKGAYKTNPKGVAATPKGLVFYAEHRRLGVVVNAGVNAGVAATL
jgi:hypothetical protein